MWWIIYHNELDLMAQWSLQPIVVKLPPPGCRLQGGGLIYIIQKLQGRRRVQGAAALQGPPPSLVAIVASLVIGAVTSASPSWGGTSPSPPTSPLYHPNRDSLANMMFDSMYYFHVIYCVAMSCLSDYLFMVVVK
jgi:hypothetical protein